MRVATRSTFLLLVLCVTAVLPGAALAVAPINDSILSPAALNAPFTLLGNIPAAPNPPVLIAATAADGGWVDATTTEDTQAGAPAVPTCLLSSGYHSMWYVVKVPEASVLKITLVPGDASAYDPLITILDPGNNPGSVIKSPSEVACALGGPGLRGDSSVSASSYVTAGNYLVRIASAVATPNNADLPTLQLSASLRDVNPPQIAVAVSKIVGVHKPVTFNATASTDGMGTNVNPGSAAWTFQDAGKPSLGSGLVVTHAWATPGFHLVTLNLQDNIGNSSTYSFNVFVHSFVPPKVRVRVVVPKPGASSMRVVIRHDMPVRVRLVVLQTGSILRVIPAKVLKGSGKSTLISIPLTQRVKKTGNVFVSGTASDLSTNPNTVSLRTCSVHPGKPGMVCA